MHQLPAVQRAKEQTLTSARSPSGRPLTPVLLLSCLTLAADRITKFLVILHFQPGESRPLIPPILHLTYVQNTGAAFGLFKGQQLVFIGVSLLVCAWIIRELMVRSALPASTIWAYGLIFGGAVGNLIDRIRFGYVVDFIDCRVWPVFNVGDSAITIGVALLILNTLMPHQRQATSNRQHVDHGR